MSHRIVLDASALLALLGEEPGAEMVASHLNHACMSAVNYCEVLTILNEKGMPDNLAKEMLADLIEVIPFNEHLATVTANLRKPTKAYDLSLGDRACIALGIHLATTVLTADKAWAKLSIQTEIKLIR
jgi:PIN domain nuclease of toxin-antitoxin system